MDEQIIRHGSSLLILMSVNIVLGSLGALFVKRFNWRYFIQGIIKAVIIIACFAATYFVGSINQDIIAVNISGIEANVKTALDIIVLMGYVHYAKQVIEKLAALIDGDFHENIKPPKSKPKE